ncbi:E3 ubiquitin ligase BIG BROTHER-related isoform X1 [Rhodamnia argentea]|uniref:E3 ubiquitin ligase BIG BROTHER-related isoform X1 n=1 Tax=Rhodamnia argentea TaxID=178133 RepID=A0A8B8QKA7_9MYRT|nr:E3 ubiquitin ligase BIG BROTHER-related isoform X1 [Rhodamnia argentea]
MADDGKQGTKINGDEAREERQENPGTADDGATPVESDGCGAEGGGDGSGRSREGSDGEEEEEAAAAQELPQANPRSSSRTPFTGLSQVDADWALARTLQEQERAFMVLRLNTEGSDYGSWEGGSYIPDEDDDFEDPDGETDEEDDDIVGSYDGTDVDDEDAFDVHAAEDANGDSNQAVELETENFSSDEAYARALQDAEDRVMAARMLALAGLNDRVVEEAEDHHDNQDTWEDVDPDELVYEELLALGDVVGTESRGLSADTIASLSSVSYKTGSSQHGTNDSCVICRLDYEDGEMLTVLSCKHSYHSECINNWLQINRVCPVCSAEVSGSANS